MSGSSENTGSSIKLVQSIKSSVTTAMSVTLATLTRPSPFAEPEIYQLYLKYMAPPKNPDWIDMISMEIHPAFVKPPPNRHGVLVWETIGENTSIDELLVSKQGVHYSSLILCSFF